MKRMTVFLALAFFLAATVAAAAESRDEFREAGRAFWKTRENPDAFLARSDAFLAGTTISAFDRSYALAMRGQALIGKGDAVGGETDATAAVRTDPEQPWGYLVLSNALLEQGRYEEAAAALDRAAECYPEGRRREKIMAKAAQIRVTSRTAVPAAPADADEPAATEVQPAPTEAATPTEPSAVDEAVTPDEPAAAPDAVAPDEQAPSAAPPPETRAEPAGEAEHAPSTEGAATESPVIPEESSFPPAPLVTPAPGEAPAPSAPAKPVAAPDAITPDEPTPWVPDRVLPAPFPENSEEPAGGAVPAPSTEGMETEPSAVPEEKPFPPAPPVIPAPEEAPAPAAPPDAVTPAEPATPVPNPPAPAGASSPAAPDEAEDEAEPAPSTEDTATEPAVVPGPAIPVPEAAPSASGGLIATPLPLEAASLSLPVSGETVAAPKDLPAADENGAAVGRNSFFVVECTFPASAGEELARIPIGQEVTVTGIVRDVSMSRITLDECELR